MAFTGQTFWQAAQAMQPTSHSSLTAFPLSWETHRTMTSAFSGSRAMIFRGTP